MMNESVGTCGKQPEARAPDSVLLESVALQSWACVCVCVCVRMFVPIRPLMHACVWWGEENNVQRQRTVWKS